MVKGTKRETTSGEKTFHVGLTKVEVAAVNPTKSELNKLMGKDDSDDDVEFEYLSEDKEGNQRVRLVFWLFSQQVQRMFRYSFLITNKVRLNKAGDKAQVLNQTLDTSWVPFDADTETTDHSDLQDWFVEFQDKDRQKIGNKIVREALIGEEELASIMKKWLGGLNWYNPDADALLDMNKLFEGDFNELQSLVDGEFASPFVAMVGVKTDESDTSKQYQEVYGKTFLAESYMPNIEKNFKGAKDGFIKGWKKFVDDIEGEYGFKSFFKLSPIEEYNKEEDPNVTPTAKKAAPAAPEKKAPVKATSSKF